ncbi:hypothetical protein [Nocardia aurantia]|uniref:Uncharacterized protein n=1 Tax=Nocardia aurantia TaxID=2585199 RepID=A0A7K0DTM9_9NOCA|nr:hypothetical protein [Nocardia aurantia]MQY28887.1 hypothetical protein [Nocardia aurantia]
MTETVTGSCSSPKLVVSAAMTHGRLSAEAVEAALASYNDRTAGHGIHCTIDEFRRYAEIHHHLTAPYLHRHGYHHSWTDVRPWPEPAPGRADPTAGPISA